MNIFIITLALMGYVYGQENPEQVAALKAQVEESVQIEMSSEDNSQITVDILKYSGTFDYAPLDYTIMND